jgi:hypothetical protein
MEMDAIKITCEYMIRIHMTENRNQWRAPLDSVMNLLFP